MKAHNNRFVNGLPILRMEDKLEALKSCIDDGFWEDAIGHLADIYAHAIEYGEIDVSREEMFEMYFKHPVPIATPVLDELAKQADRQR